MFILCKTERAIGVKLTEALSLLPEHLNSWSCKSATFCPLSCPGEWQRVYGANRGALRRNFESHDKWQSHANGLSLRRRARSRGILVNISRGNVVKLLLLSVRISSSWRLLTACSSMHTIWLWSNCKLRSAETPLNIRFDIAAISLFDKSLWGDERERENEWKKFFFSGGEKTIMSAKKGENFTYTRTKLDMLANKLSGSALILLLFNRLRNKSGWKRRHFWLQTKF